MNLKSLVIAVAISIFTVLVTGRTIGAGEKTEYTVYIPLLIGTPNKLGIAPGGYVYGDFERTRPAWTYRWNNEFYSETLKLGIQQVDMLWSDRYLYMPIKSDVILGFNEPDLDSQANMTPLQGAIAWRWIETTYPSKTLVSPSPAQLNSSGWLWQMVDAYELLYGTRPRFDGIGVHYYHWTTGQAMFSEAMQEFRADELAHGYTVPLWVTETGACGDDELAYLEDVVSFTNATDWIARVAWYKFAVDYYDTSSCSTLLNDDRTLTPLGVEYREVANGF